MPISDKAFYIIYDLSSVEQLPDISSKLLTSVGLHMAVISHLYVLDIKHGKIYK